MQATRAYVGLDVHKDTIAVAVAEGERSGEVRFWGNIANSPAELQVVVRKIMSRHPDVEFCYEAGPCGYDVYRQLTSAGVRVKSCGAKLGDSGKKGVHGTFARVVP
jgi:hypothetical protein